MNELGISKNWFSTWFDSPYYHKLYCNRNLKEADFFIKNLLGILKLAPENDVLDLACGKGRHAYFLSKFNLNVLGLDLSENSINEAQKFAHARLKFAIHDMREIYPNKKFDAIFNLFTSFGYFDSENDNVKMLESVNSMLKPKGKLIIDFMNASKVIENLVLGETKELEETTFHIQRKYDGRHIFKDITFEAENKNFHFTERVQALEDSDFDKLLKQTGFKINSKFGNYDLSQFDIKNSPRLILIATKL